MGYCKKIIAEFKKERQPGQTFCHVHLYSIKEVNVLFTKNLYFYTRKLPCILIEIKGYVHEKVATPFQNQ